MSGSAIPIVLQQLVFQGPTLVAYLVGMILAFKFLGRCRVPAILTLLAIGMLILTSIATIAWQTYVANSRWATGSSVEDISRSFLIVGVVSSLMRATAFGLLLAAIFTGRNTAAPLNPPQFSMRTLLIGMTIFCVIAGLISVLIAWTS
jgi:hypothetical protein